jgi:HEAT repeat protein
LRNDPSPLVRAASATALGRFLYLGEMEKISQHRRDQVYSALMGALMNSAPGSVVYQHALESLAYVSNEEVERHIREAYASDNQALRVTAVVAMGRSNDHKYSPLVRRELHNVLPAMRVEAARACGELEVAEAVPDLARLLEDPDGEVAVTAIGALGQIGGDEARKLLERAAASDDDEISEAAEDALAEDEFLHGDLKFTTLWFEDLRKDGAGDKSDDE